MTKAYIVIFLVSLGAYFILGSIQILINMIGWLL